MTRKPSCLISCSQNDPEGGCGALVGRHGGMNPVGKARCNMPNVIGQRAVLGESKAKPQPANVVERDAISRDGGRVSVTLACGISRKDLRSDECCRDSLKPTPTQLAFQVASGAGY